MLGEAAAGLTALNHLKNQILGLKDLNDQAKVNDAIIEIQQATIDLQFEIYDLNAARDKLYEENQDLKRQISAMQSTTDRFDRYELKDFGSNTFAYALKDEFKGEEPDHLMCAHCFGEQKLSILQFIHKCAEKQDWYGCKSCGQQTRLGTPVPDDYQPPRGRYY